MTQKISLDYTLNFILNLNYEFKIRYLDIHDL